MGSPPTVLDRAISVEDAVRALGEKGVEVSPRTLKERAKEIGAYRQIGRAVFFLPEDLKRIMEPPACSNSSDAPKARTGSRGAPSTVVGLKEAQVRLQRARRAND